MRFVLHCRSMCMCNSFIQMNFSIRILNFRIMDAMATCYALFFRLELKYHFWLTYPNRISQHDYALKFTKERMRMCTKELLPVQTNSIHESVGELSIFHGNSFESVFIWIPFTIWDSDSDLINKKICQVTVNQHQFLDEIKSKLFHCCQTTSPFIISRRRRKKRFEAKNNFQILIS